MLILGRRFRHFEINLFKFINNKMHCSFLNIFMKTMSCAGSA